MKIVLANRYFYPDESATSRMVSSLAFSLAQQGFSVTALASRHFHDKPEPRLPARETINGVSVHRLATSGFGRAGLSGRAVDYATFHLSAAGWWLANTRRGDLCVICTDPPLLSVSSILPVMLRRGRLVNWVMDLFPEVAAELGVLPKAGRAQGLAQWLRDWSLRQSALTICPVEAMTRYLALRVPERDRVVTVHHWSDGAEIRPVRPSENSLRREWGLEDHFVVGYSGNFGRAHDFFTMLAAAQQLREHEDIRFLLIGDGQRRAETEKEVARLNLPNVIFKPYQPREVLSNSLGAADVHIVSLLPALEYCIVPSKFYGILASGRPTLFVGDPEGEIGSVVQDAGCGKAIPLGDADALAAQIMQLKIFPAERHAMGENARRLLEQEYSRHRGVERWRDAIARLGPEDGARAPSQLPQEVVT